MPNILPNADGVNDTFKPMVFSPLERIIGNKDLQTGALRCTEAFCDPSTGTVAAAFPNASEGVSPGRVTFKDANRTTRIILLMA
jgi:hypothetical protein